MNLESRHLFSDSDPVVDVDVFSPFCAKCDLLIPIGHTARKFDGSTYYHPGMCPNRPLRRYALRRLKTPGTYTYPMEVNMDLRG
jgi:hypothetical protein